MRIEQLIGPDADPLLEEFAQILHKRHANRVLCVIREAERVVGRNVTELKDELIAEGLDSITADIVARTRLQLWIGQVLHSRDALIEQEKHGFMSGIQELLRWWEFTGWNPENHTHTQRWG